MAASATCNARMVSLATLRYFDSIFFNDFLPVVASTLFVIHASGHQETCRLVLN